MARAPDSRRLLVAPLQTATLDSGLARIAGNLGVLLAAQLTIGELRADLAPELVRVGPDQRRTTASRLGAGALVDGSLVSIGDQFRVAVRLLDTRSGTQLATVTLPGTTDSLGALADRVSLVLLNAWWAAQPGPREHKALSTGSLTAQRHYIAAMHAWGLGSPAWTTRLDSAVRADPEFLEAWRWLAVPDSDFVHASGSRRAQLSAPSPVIATDSAMRVLARAGRSRAPSSLDRMILRLAAGGSGNIPGEAAAPFCRYQPALAEDRSVEAQYLWARNVRLAILAGCSDSLAIAAAQRVVQLDSTFVPAWTLLVDALVWRGDVTAARRWIARPPVGDTAVVAPLRSLADLRAGERPAVGSDLLTLLAWHEFGRADSLIAHFEIDRVPGSGGGFRTGLGRLSDAPVRAARGEVARIVARAREFGGRGGPRMGADQDTAEFLWTLGTIAAVGLAPDTSVLGRTRSLAFLDSVLSPQSVARAVTAPSSPTSGLDVVARSLWSASVYAAQLGDDVRAMRFLGALDELGRRDSLRVRPIALAARGEVALLLEKPASWLETQRLFSRAHMTSLIGTPERCRWLLARRAAETGNAGEALALLRSITTPSPAHPPDHLAYYAPALLLEGKVLEGMGRRDAALRRYREYVAVRRDADPRFQADVADARRRIVALEARR